MKLPRFLFSQFVLLLLTFSLPHYVSGQVDPDALIPVEVVPSAVIRIEAAPGTDWENKVPLEITVEANDVIGDYRFSGNDVSALVEEERGDPLFSSSIIPGSVFYAADQVTGMVASDGGSANGIPVNRPGWSSFIAANLDPRNGEWLHWINGSARAVNTVIGADWEYQVRYFSGTEGFPAKLEIGTVPNAGFFDGDEIAPENYSVEINWQVATAQLPALTGFQAYEMIRTRFLEERPESLFADPIDTATGAQSIQYRFLEQNGVVPFALDIYYYSLAKESGPLGVAWSHGFEKRIEVDGGNLYLYGPVDARHLFTPDGAGAYICQSRSGPGHLIFDRPGGGWELRMPDASREEYDAQGRLVARISPNSFRIDLTYDGEGKLARVEDAITGYSIAFDYTVDGKIERASDGQGRKVAFAYQANRLQSIDRTVLTTSGGDQWVRARFVYDDFDRLIQGLGANLSSDGSVTGEFQVFRNQFDPFGRIVAQWGFGAASGATATDVASSFSYLEDTEAGRVVTVAQYPSSSTFAIPPGQVADQIAAGKPDHADIFTHSEGGELLSVRYHRESPLGEMSFTYDENGQVATKTNIQEVTTTYARDGSGRILTETVDGLGTRTWTYDPEGRMTGFEARDGSAYAWQFDGSGRLLQKTVADGSVTTYTRNSEGLLVSVQPPVGGETTYALADGMVASATDALGRVTGYSYDDAGRLVEVERADGTRFELNLDHLGQTLEERINGTTVNAWTYDYREPHRPVLVSQIDRFGGTSHWDFAEPGETREIGYSLTTHPIQRPLLASSDGISEILYDHEPRYGTLQRMLTDTGGSGIVDDIWMTITHELQSIAPAETLPRLTTRGYDGFDSAGSADFAYRKPWHDEYGRLQRVGMYDWPMKDLFDLGYLSFDSFDRPNALVEDLSEGATQARTLSYDSENRLGEILDGERTVADFDYDADGRLVGMLYEGLSASRQVAADGLTEELVGPAGGVFAFSYDDARNLESITWPDAGQTLFETDAAGRVSAVVTPSGDRSSYSYNQYDELLSETDEDGVTSYQYDADGRLAAVARGDDEVLIGLDQRDRLTLYTDAWGNAYQFTYDNQNLLKTITYPDGSVVTYTYVAGYNLARIECEEWGLQLDFQSGRTLNAGYHTGVEGDEREIFLNTDGIALVKRTVSRLESSIEIRDNLGWSVLSSVTVDKESIEAKDLAWDWDSIYFAPDERILPESIALERGADGRVSFADTFGLTYDADGQLAQDGRPDGYGSLQWDARGKLLAAANVDYTYDPAGNLMGWTDSGGETKLSFVPLKENPALYFSEDPAGNRVFYIHGPDGVLAEYSEAEGLRMYHYDPSGNATFMVSAEGNVLAARQYEPFGKRIAESGPWPSLLGYRGREGLPTSPNGLVYMNARHYAPDLQNFLSPDPVLPDVSIPASFDRYAYAYGDPLVFTDPSGAAPDAGGKMAHATLREAFEAVFGPSYKIEKIDGDLQARIDGEGTGTRSIDIREGMSVLSNVAIGVGSGRVMLSNEGNRVILGTNTTVLIDNLPDRVRRRAHGKYKEKQLKLRRGKPDIPFPLLVPPGSGVRSKWWIMPNSDPGNSVAGRRG